MELQPSSCKFEYESLEPGQFRLLTVVSTKDGFDCELEKYTLDNPPTYDAISYAWGPKEAAVEIKCNARHWKVSPQLASMLHHFLLYRPPPAHHKIWIDALCINQNDEEEKARQIPYMRTIYGKAHRVIVWLGEHENNSELVMQSIPDLSNKLKNLGPVVHLAHHEISASLIKNDLPDLEHHLWPAIGHLFSRSWFQRLWVLQEVALSQQMLVMCGNTCLAGDIFIAFCKAFDAESNPGLLRGKQITLRTGSATNILGCIARFNDACKEGRYFKLPRVFSVGRELNCSVQVDHIYGMLGLISPVEEQSIATLGLIDYTKPYWRTCIDISKWYLPFDPSLELLCLAASNVKHAHIPSWCPDWENKLETAPFHGYKTHQAGRQGVKDKRSRVREIERTDHIGIEGVRVDEVLQVAETGWDVVKEQTDLGRSICSWELECLSMSRRAYGLPPDNLPEGHWRTLAANEISGHLCEREEFEKYLDFISFISPSKDSKQTLTRGGKDYFSSLGRANLGRRFFTTKQGRTGLGPTGIKSHDTICVLYYGGPLFALRFDEGKNTALLMGEAYVHGLMSGEALTMEGRNEDECFILR